MLRQPSEDTEQALGYEGLKLCRRSAPKNTPGDFWRMALPFINTILMFLVTSAIGPRIYVNESLRGRVKR